MKFKILLTLVLLLVLSACIQERVEPIPDQMKQQLALLPQEVDVLGYINLNKIQQSAISKVFMDSAQQELFHNHEFEEFKSATGFDFQKDAKNVYFAFGMNSEEKGLDGIFIVEGNFDPEKILGFINSKDEKKQVVTESYNNAFKIYRLAEEQTVFCFPTAQYLFGGKESIVKASLDKFGQTVKPNISNELLQRIEPLKYKNGFWLVMTTKNFTELMDQNHSLPKNFQGIKNIKSGSFSMDFSDQLSFYGQGECIDAETADLLRDAVKGLLASVKLAVSDERDVVDTINKVNVESKKEKVIVHFKMNTEEIKKLIEKRKAYSRSI